MPGWLFGILVFLAAFVGSWIAAVALGIAFGEIAGVSQREGAYAMGLVFAIGPMAGLLGAVVITALAVSRRRRRLTG